MLVWPFINYKNNGRWGTPPSLAGSPWGNRGWESCSQGGPAQQGLRACLSLPELPENWTDTRETLLEGMIFSLKYLGMTLVEQPKGEEMSAAAVKRIVATVSPSWGEPGPASFRSAARPLLIIPIGCV